MKWVRIGSAALLMFAFTACDSLDDLSELEVINQNAPDRERALETASDIEALIGGAFAIWYEGTYWGNPAMALHQAADEGSMSWGNFGGQQLSSEPRVAWPNSPSWRYNDMTEQPWYDNFEALSAVYDALQSLDQNPELCESIDCDRARAFGKFVQGLSHGYIALMFDSAFVFDETIDLETDVLELQPYPTVMAAALGYFDDAIALAQGGSWTLPNNWVNGNPYTPAEFIQMVNSFWVRYVTQFGRNPTEHNNLGGLATWNDVITRIDAGITDDINIDGDGANLWWHAMIWYGAQSFSTTWTRADYKTIGWGEIEQGTGTGYTNWLATPVAQRNEFVLQTLDERISPPDGTPADGGDGTGQGLDFQYQGPSTFRPDRGTYHFSHYMHYRYEDYPITGGQTPSPIMLREEMDMTKAEALFRTGDPDGAAAIINVTRVGRGNLPAAAGADADLLNKIVYEYRIENFLACSGCSYFTRRGWGPLVASGPNHHEGPVEGTPAHFAVPGAELEILQKLLYTYGGVGNEGVSLSPAGANGARGTTVPASMVYRFGDAATLAEKVDRVTNRGPAISASVINLTRH